MSFIQNQDMATDEFQDISQQLYFLAIGNVCQCGDPKARAMPLCESCCKVIGRPWLKTIRSEVNVRRYQGRVAITSLDWAIDYIRGRARIKAGTSGESV
jgi:hypothetical protein